MGKIVGIISDGSAQGTKVLLSDGTELAQVVGVEWWITAETGVARAEITVEHVPVKLAGSLGEWKAS